MRAHRDGRARDRLGRRQRHRPDRRRPTCTRAPATSTCARLRGDHAAAHRLGRHQRRGRLDRATGRPTPPRATSSSTSRSPRSCVGRVDRLRRRRRHRPAAAPTASRPTPAAATTHRTSRPIPAATRIIRAQHLLGRRHRRLRELIAPRGVERHMLPVLLASLAVAVPTADCAQHVEGGERQRRAAPGGAAPVGAGGRRDVLRPAQRAPARLHRREHGWKAGLGVRAGAPLRIKVAVRDRSWLALDYDRTDAVRPRRARGPRDPVRPGHAAVQRRRRRG